MRQYLVTFGAIALVGVTAVSAMSAQDAALRQAAERVQAAWLSHDVRSMVQSDSMTLRLRGTQEEPGPVSGGQAARILARYLEPVSEVAFDLRTVRVASPSQAYVEAVRRYVVRGTSEPVVETVLLGFGWQKRGWELTEVRITP